MAYCTETDLSRAIPEATLIELTDDAASGALDSNVTAAAIAAAGAEIDAHLAQVVDLPLASIPDPVKQIAVDLAVSWLYARTGIEIPASWTDRRERAREYLRRIASGELNIDPRQATAGPATIQADTRTQIFTSTKLDKF